MKKLLYLIISISTLFLACYLYQLNHNVKKFSKFCCIEDISMQQINECKLKLPGKVWLISYAGGENKVHLSNQLVLMHSALNNCIDNIKAYNPTSLDTAFVQKNKKILSLPRGNGYWLWKPYIILDTLKQIPDGDIVLYLDSGVEILKDIDTLLNNLSTHAIIAFENSHTNRQYVKRDLLKLMGIDTPEVRDSIHLQASYLAFKNNKSTRKFVKKWLELCENEIALTDTPSIDEYTDFLDHRHDQAILSLLYLSHKNYFKILDLNEAARYFNHHRRRDVNTSVKTIANFCYTQSNLSFINKVFKWFHLDQITLKQ